MKSIQLILTSCCLVLFLSINSFAQRLYVQNNSGCDYTVEPIVNDGCDMAITNPIHIPPGSPLSIYADWNVPGFWYAFGVSPMANIPSFWQWHAIRIVNLTDMSVTILGSGAGYSCPGPFAGLLSSHPSISRVRCGGTVFLAAWTIIGTDLHIVIS